MTRANFEIVTKHGKVNMQGNSSCYPSWVMSTLIAFATCTRTLNTLFKGKVGFYDEPEGRDIAEFIDGVDATFGSVGNPSYYYLVDFKNKVVKVWNTKKRWVNAPVDWEAKGWKGCYENGKGKFGYNSIIKGKCIYQKSFYDLVSDEATIKEDVIEEAETMKTFD